MQLKLDVEKDFKTEALFTKQGGQRSKQTIKNMAASIAAANSIAETAGGGQD